MAHWQYRINVAEEWTLAEERKITVRELCTRILPKLQALPYYENDSQFDDIVMEIEGMTEDNSYTYDDFDVTLRDLYDWGDYDHRLWIETIITEKQPG